MFLGPFQLTGEPPSDFPWAVFTLITSLLAYPVFAVAAWLKLRTKDDADVSILWLSLRNAAKALLPMFGFTLLGGYFVVGFGMLAATWVLKLIGLPSEFFDIGRNPQVFYMLLFGFYALWYVFSCVVITRWLPRSRDDPFIRL